MSSASEPINQLPKPSILEKLVQRHSKLAMVLVAVFIIVFVYGMVTAPNFLTLFNLKTIIRDAALVGIMAIGLTFVTLSGNFFLLSLFYRLEPNNFTEQLSKSSARNSGKT
mgnify:CR=1 FL=1